MKYFKDNSGNTHSVETYGWTNNTSATICIDNSIVKTLKMYYRHERTWDDHIGNTPCGYYVIVPYNKEKHRVYIDLAR